MVRGQLFIHFVAVGSIHGGEDSIFVAIDNLACEPSPSLIFARRDRLANAVTDAAKPAGKIEIPFPQVSRCARIYQFWRGCSKSIIAFAPRLIIFVSYIISDVNADRIN